MKSSLLLKLLIITLPLFFLSGWDVMSYAVDPVSRQTEIIIPYVEYEWWLMRWEDNSYECRIIIDHEGLPTPDEIYLYCGNARYLDWLETEPCNPALEGVDTSNCTGFYLHKVSSEAKEKTISVNLPLPEAWISISGCNLISPSNTCPTLPNLLITGIEPLPNETVIQIQGTYNEIPFLCVGNSCEVPLRPTTNAGVEIKFWVDSSYGDSSEQYSALVRVLDAGVSIGPHSGGWLIDIMSNRWQNYQANGCGPIWGSFPPTNGLPNWLSSPEWPQLLTTNDPYMYLAGKLISNGIIDASTCPDGGIETNGYANMCGLNLARGEVDQWQNRFDVEIVSTAQETGIPSQLLKNMFAIESQFWPGVNIEVEEHGFGQLTELGADTLLLWDPTFFYQFCPLVLNEESCLQGYLLLAEEDQIILRGALAKSASLDCPNCPANIDLTHSAFSIDLFAKTIIANCQQVGQIITNVSGKSPGAVVDYIDLWLFTLANYHSGAGCLTRALFAAGSPYTWDNIVIELEKECPGTQNYVEEVIK